MTTKAIALLNRVDKRFFLQVEGASIDKRYHSADACGQIGETVDLDEAVQAAMAFAKKDGNTSADDDQLRHRRCHRIPAAHRHPAPDRRLRTARRERRRTDRPIRPTCSSPSPTLSGSRSPTRSSAATAVSSWHPAP